MDYLITNGMIDEGKVLNSFEKYSKDGVPDTFIKRIGDWWVVFSGASYPGFEPFEDDNYFVLALGAPLLRSDRSDLKSFCRSDLTAQALKYLIAENDHDPNAFLGGFQIIVFDKINNSVSIFNDKIGLVPIYYCNLTLEGSDFNELWFSSHVDVLAKSWPNENEIDAVSVADFLTFQTVTFPFTFYKNIFQVEPSSWKRVTADGFETLKDFTVKKLDVCRYSSIEESADHLFNLVKEAEDRISSYSGGSLNILFSGGEDSRALLCTLDDPAKVRAYTVCDSFNAEARIAKAVCDKAGCDWELIKRPPTHYMDNILKSVRVSESHNFFYHAHFNGFEQFDDSGKVFLGGLAADAFCKAAKVRKVSSFGIVKDYDKEFWQYRGTKNLLKTGALHDPVFARRHRHNLDAKNKYGVSWQEYHALYPASMNTNFANFFINRRLFASFEPFADGSVFEWSVQTPVGWKLNRRVFHLAFKRSFMKCWSIPNSKGTFPYFGHLINGPLLWGIENFKRRMRGLKRRFNARVVNDGPWPVWRNVVQSENFRQQRIQGHEIPLRSLLGSDAFELLETSLDSNDPVQALAGLHVKIWAEDFMQPR